MSVKLSKGLLSSPTMTKTEKLKVMKARQAALAEVAVQVLTARGYEVGPSLKIPGAPAFEARHAGKRVRIGVKTSADRWVALPRGDKDWGVISRVDEIFVVAFNDWKEPTRIQLYSFDPKTLIDIGERVYAEAHDRRQTGMQWVPLDSQPGRNSASLIAGELSKYGTLLFDEDIEWVSSGRSETSAPNPEPQPSGGTVLKLTIPQAKAGLAAHFGVPEEAITITIHA